MRVHEPTAGATAAQEGEPAGSYRGGEVRHRTAAKGGAGQVRAGAGSSSGHLGTPPPACRREGECGII